MAIEFAANALDNMFYLTVWSICLAALIIGVYIFNAQNFIETSRMRTVVLLVLLMMFVGLIITEVLIGYSIYLDGVGRE